MQSKQLESPSLGIASKITLIALSFSLPIGVLVYLMVASINANITVARLEQTGNAYLRPLVDTLARVQDHQLAAAKCAPTRVDCSAELNPLKQKVEEAFRSLADVDARHGVDLKFTSEELAKRGRSQQTLTAARAQ